MQDAMADVFLTMADNTNVEWRMDRYKDNSYALGTWHKADKSPNSTSLSGGKFNDHDLIALIHSHPMLNIENPTSITSQKESMGYNDLVSYGDVYLKRISPYLKDVYYYTYFPKTQQLWSVEFYEPRFIRKITSYKRLFFRTLNSK